MERFYKWLDKYVLPWPVRFLTNPLVILFTFLMLIPLIKYADSVVFVLVANSYMNVTSVGVSSIVLRQTMLTADSQEKRAQQDHEMIKEQFDRMNQLFEQQTNEIAELKEMHIAQDQQIEELKQMHQELHAVNSMLGQALEKHLTRR